MASWPIGPKNIVCLCFIVSFFVQSLVSLDLKGSVSREGHCFKVITFAVFRSLLDEKHET